MINIELDVPAVARTRIAASAVWEVAASLMALCRPHEHVLHARLRERLPRRANYDTALLADLSRGHAGWSPDALAPAPTAGQLSALEQLELVAATPTDAAAADLAVLRAAYPRGRYAAWAPQEYADRLAAALVAYWSTVLAPLWDRVTAIQDADISHHTQAVAGEGLAAALSGMHPDLSLEGEGLQVRRHAWTDPVSAVDRGVWLVPSVFLWPDVLVSPSVPAIGYGARGAGRLWADDGVAPPPSLAGLVGRSRAAILGELDIPRTTTLLASRVDLSPPTVSAHLSVMTGAGLLTSHRNGRRVLYRRTALGDELVARAAGCREEDRA